MSLSTDKLSRDTNPEVPRVVERGKVTMINHIAAGSMYYGSISVVTTIQSASNCDVEATLWDGTTLSPFSSCDFDGLSFTAGIRKNYWFEVTKSTTGSNENLCINFYYFSRTQDESLTIYYTVYSNAISDTAIL